MAKKRFRIRDKRGNVINYDVGADDITLDGENGKDLPTKLAEMEAQIEGAGQGDGTVTGVKVGSTTYPPNGDGVVDISPAIPDVSGKANKSEMSVVPGTGANADKTTITLKEGTNATVLTQHQDISGKVDKENGKVLIPSTDLAKLQNLPTADQLTQQLGQKANENAVVKSVSVNGTAQMKDQNGNVNIQVQAGGESIVFDTEGTPIIDSPLSPNADTVLGAASARWVKEIDNNVKAILAALANIAFTTGKPTWEAVQKRKYDLTMNTSTLTGCTGTVVSGDAGNGQVYEGGVQIKLTPTQASYAFTSVTVNGESVATTATGDADGSVYLDIVVNGDITVAATAISGYSVSLGSGSTNVTLQGTNALPNQSYSCKIVPDPHCTLPSQITVTMNGSNVDFTATGNSYDDSTGDIHIANVTGDIVIVAEASLNAKITVTLPSDEHIVAKYDNEPIMASTFDVYSDMLDCVITFEPAEGYGWDNVPVASGGGTMANSGKVYTLTIGNSDTTDISVAASTKQIQLLTVTLPAVQGVSFEDANGNTISSGSSIEEGGIFECYINCGAIALNGTVTETETGGEVVKTFTATSDAVPTLFLLNVKVMMGIQDITRDVLTYATELTSYNVINKGGENNKWKITIPNVTDPVVVSEVKTAGFLLNKFGNRANLVSKDWALGWAHDNGYIGNTDSSVLLYNRIFGTRGGNIGTLPTTQFGQSNRPHYFDGTTSYESYQAERDSYSSATQKMYRDIPISNIQKSVVYGIVLDEDDYIDWENSVELFKGMDFDGTYRLLAKVGYYVGSVDVANGTISETASVLGGITDYIEAEYSESMPISYNLMASSAMILCYNSNKELIGSISNSSNATTIKSTGLLQNTAYIKISIASYIDRVFVWDSRLNNGTGGYLFKGAAANYTPS